MLTGLSLSLCVSTIASGDVPLESVTKIVAGIKVATPQEWEDLLTDYRTLYWRRNTDECVRIARQLWDEGKIEQPRLTGGTAPYLRNRIGFWVETGDEIQYES